MIVEFLLAVNVSVDEKIFEALHLMFGTHCSIFFYLAIFQIKLKSCTSKGASKFLEKPLEISTTLCPFKRIKSVRI